MYFMYFWQTPSGDELTEDVALVYGPLCRGRKPGRTRLWEFSRGYVLPS
jgi:hypothetical protein